jgi:SNF2 family DNA or RNA helicase
VLTIALLGYLKHLTKPTKEKKSRDTTDPKKEEEKTDCHMLVVPKWTIDNWMKAFKSICSSLRVVKYLGDKKKRVSCLKSLLFIH